MIKYAIMINFKFHDDKFSQQHLNNTAISCELFVFAIVLFSEFWTFSMRAKINCHKGKEVSKCNKSYPLNYYFSCAITYICDHCCYSYWFLCCYDKQIVFVFWNLTTEILYTNNVKQENLCRAWMIMWNVQCKFWNVFC